MRWRTNAWELSVGNISVGSSIYTSDPKNEGGVGQPEGRSNIYGLNDFFNDGLGAWSNGIVHSSPLWVGVKFGTSVSRVGISRPGIQDVQQDGIHKYFKPGHQNFYNIYDQNQINSSYIYNGYYNPYSLYGK